MGVNKQTSNAAVWGETGRFPLAVELSKQVFDYMGRLQTFDRNDDQSLVRHAFCEQKTLGLSWYSNINHMKSLLESQQETIQGRETPTYRSRTLLRGMFVNIWERARLANRKLGFFNSIKPYFEQASYLSQELGPKEIRCIAQMRTSSHRLRVETGRHGKNRESIVNRACLFCSTTDMEVLRTMEELPLFDPVIEDELHVLKCCPRYDDIRQKLSVSLQMTLNEDLGAIFQSFHIKETAKLIKLINTRRDSPDVIVNTSVTLG